MPPKSKKKKGNAKGRGSKPRANAKPPEAQEPQETRETVAIQLSKAEKPSKVGTSAQLVEACRAFAERYKDDHLAKRKGPAADIIRLVGELGK